jgi:uncharacterized membrane protein (DUF485 family)
MKISSRHVFNLVVVVLLSIYVLTAWGYNPQARLFPLVVSIPILILAIGLFISDLRASRQAAAVAEEAKPPSGNVEVTPKGKFKKEVNAFVWAISLFVSLYLFGFIVTTALYTFLSLKVRSHFSWRSSIGISVGCLAFLYIVMIYGLRVDLYTGSVILALRKVFYGY